MRGVPTDFEILLRSGNPDGYELRREPSTRYGEWHVHEYGALWRISHASGFRFVDYPDRVTALKVARTLATTVPLCPLPIEELRTLRPPHPDAYRAWVQQVKAVIGVRP